MAPPRDSTASNRLNSWAQAATGTIRLSGSATALLLLLADMGSWRDEDGGWVTWPHVKTLARKLNRSPRTVQNGLRELESHGLIARVLQHAEHGGVISNRIVFNVARVEFDGIRVGRFPEERKELHPLMQEAAPPGESSCTTPRQNLHPSRAENSVHAPVLNPLENPSSSSSVPEQGTSALVDFEEEEPQLYEAEAEPAASGGTAEVATLRHRGIALPRLRHDVDQLIREHPGSGLTEDALADEPLQALVESICADPDLTGPVKIPERLVASYLAHSPDKCLTWLQQSTGTSPADTAKRPNLCVFAEHAHRGFRDGNCPDCKAQDGIPSRVTEAEYAALDERRQRRVDERRAAGQTAIVPTPSEQSAA
ncbi:hypothetical protein GCM10011401_27630 [Nesterenkonia cremea]|uniref:Helix-turn-helix domain-containing protein n=1 Tax=Nesterenkonia cremea TaxID=1882340 RepID=A0A917ES48_9MICC|nr:hypothetical protein GCM10011401_27630 [Nesterenkonia cremea]